MNSAVIVGILTVLAVAWTLRAMWLDLQRERRRVARLRAVNADLRERVEFLLDELDDAALIAQLEAQQRHPSQASNVRVLRGVK
jgi:hypothetical protein